jgi:hypothetical protein
METDLCCIAGSKISLIQPKLSIRRLIITKDPIAGLVAILLIGLLGEIGFSPGEHGSMNLPNGAVT